jgi:HTH-type transcriptional repressor of NAD biosynthesis genes
MREEGVTSGLVLGKFLPPHLGHVYLVEFARAYTSQVTVVVGTLAREPIPGELRFRWMRELFPDLDVVHLTDENPQEPHEHPRFWDIWRESLLRVAPRKPDLVFASEKYGERLAKELGARWVPVDLARTAAPVSGTAIRSDPMKHWRYLPRCVRPYFAKRVCVAGPESTGKSTLARDLAAHFGTTWVPEYARALLEPRAAPGETAPIALPDMLAIARGQMASEEALARNAERVLVSDTVALTTLLWSDHFFGEHDPALDALAEKHTHDLYLLTSPDVSYVQDAVRYAPKDRAAFFDRMRAELVARKRRHVVLEGDWEARRARAISAVGELVAITNP